MKDLQIICMTQLSISNSDFFDMCLLEIEYMLKENARNNRLNQLDLAYYISCLSNNEKANDTYLEIRDNINGIKSIRRLKKDIARYRMISERLRLNFPKKGT